MIEKILAGSLAVVVLAAIVLFNLLMSAKEANGQLTADLETAVEFNTAQTEKIAQQEENMRQLQEDYAAEQARAAAFTEAVVAGQVELERQKRDHAIELAGVRDSLTPEERACADERVPDAYYGMREHGDSDPDGVHRPASTDAG